MSVRCLSCGGVTAEARKERGICFCCESGLGPPAVRAQKMFTFNPGICMDCGKPAPRDGCHQCERCRITAWADENERTGVMDEKPY